jgi:tryptophan synthase alpha subunit
MPATKGFQIEERHMTKTTIALAAALLMGTATVAMAADGSRPAKRVSGAQSTPTRMTQPTNMSAPNGNLMMNVMDRASSPFACGG